METMNLQHDFGQLSLKSKQYDFLYSPILSTTSAKGRHFENELTIQKFTNISNAPPNLRNTKKINDRTLFLSNPKNYNNF